MRPRKLLSSKVLVTLEMKVSAGIPLAAALRQMGLGISRPAVAKLLKHLKVADYYLEDEDALLLRLNLFPEWLDQDSMTVQEEPEDWCFEGYFPTRGIWLQKGLD